MKLYGFLVVSTAFILAFVGCSREREKISTAPPSVHEVQSATTVLASIADDERPPQAIPGHGVQTAGNQPVFEVIFSESGKGVAYTAQKGDKFCVVHNESRGKDYSAVGSISLSPDGRRVAYTALENGKWFIVVDGREGRRYDTALTPTFSADGRHVAYQAKEGEKWYIVVDEKENPGTTASYTQPVFNSDSTLIAYVETAASNADMRLIVSDLAFGRQSVKRSIGDLLFTTNRDKTRIAATQVVGNKLRVIDFSFANPDGVHEGPLYDLIEKLTFSEDGSSVCYCALKGRTRLIVLDSREEILPKGLLPQLPVVRPDKKGVGLLLTADNRFFLRQAFFNSREKGKNYDEAADLVYSQDGRFYAYTARKGQMWFVVVNGKEGPAFDRAVMPVFTPGGKHLLYRARKDGTRFLVLADTAGKTVKQYSSYEQVFRPVFSPDGKSIVYGVKDGNKLVCRVEEIR